MPRIETAICLRNGTTFSHIDINDPKAHALMKACELIDESGHRVSAVRHQSCPHFRKRPVPKSVQRATGDQRHGNTIEYIMPILFSSIVSIIPKGCDGKPSALPVFQQSPEVEYEWYSERQAEFSSKMGQEFVPDIAGRPKGIAFPNRRHPACIIEVLHTNPPTPKKLIELLWRSERGLIVVFWDVENKLASFRVEKDKSSRLHAKIVSNAFISEGAFFSSGQRFNRPQNMSYSQYSNMIICNILHTAPNGQLPLELVN